MQKVETTLIMQKSGQVSPSPATRTTNPYMFAMCQQTNKQNHCTVNVPECSGKLLGLPVHSGKLLWQTAQAARALGQTVLAGRTLGQTAWAARALWQTARAKSAWIVRQWKVPNCLGNAQWPSTQAVQALGQCKVPEHSGNVQLGNAKWPSAWAMQSALQLP